MALLLCVLSLPRPAIDGLGKGELWQRMSLRPLRLQGEMATGCAGGPTSVRGPRSAPHFEWFQCSGAV